MKILQSIRKNVLYPLFLLRAGDRKQLAWEAEFEKSQYLSSEELQALQLSRLRRLIQHAWKRCPAYRERLDSVELRPSSLNSFEDFQKIPILEKSDLQKGTAPFVASGWPREDLVENRSGGSTGAPVEFFMSKDRRRSRAAATLRHNRWAGWEIGDCAAYLWGAVRDAPPVNWKSRIRETVLGQQVWLDASAVSEEKLEQFHLELHRRRPRILQAYARMLYLFAQYVDQQGLRPWSPKAIVISAEALEPGERTFVENVFQAPVFNRYGSRETSVIASECEARQGMHVMAEGLYVEIVNQGRPAAPGEMGSVIITDLLNYAMPLIRYRIGDMGSWASGACPCGRSLPRIDQVHGRITDFLVGTDGELVSGVHLATYVVSQRPSLGQVQIRQHRKGDVLFRVCPGTGFSRESDFGYLESEMRSYLGDDLQVRFELVDELPREPSGKFLYFHSSVTPAFLTKNTAIDMGSSTH